MASEVNNVIFNMKAQVEGSGEVSVLADGVEKTDEKFDKANQSASRFASGARVATDETKKAGAAAEAAAPKVQRLGSTVSGAAKNFLAFAGIDAGVRAVFRTVEAGVTTLVDFEDALAELSAITGATGGDLEFLKDQAREVGKSSTLSAVDAVNAFKLMGSARPELLENKEALAAVTKEAIALAEAAKVDLATAGSAVAGAMNQFNLPAEDAGRIVNALAAGSLKGAAEVSDLGETIDKVGTVMARNNIQLEQGVGLIETLADKNLKGAVAGNQLRGVILKLVQDGKGFVNGQFNINAALEQTKKELDAIEDPAARSAAAVKLFGLENVTAGGILTDNIDRVKELTEAVTGTRTAYEQQATNTATVRAALASLRNSYADLVLTFEGSTGTLRRVIVFLADNLRDIAKVLGLVITALVTYVATTKAAQVATAAYRFVTAGLAIAKAALTGGVKGATTAMQGFNVAVKANPLGLLISLVTTAIAAFAAFSTGAEEAADAQRELNKAEEEGFKARRARSQQDKTISEQVEVADKFNAEQLANLKTTIDAQIAEYNRLLAERIVIERNGGTEVEKELAKHQANLKKLRSFNTLDLTFSEAQALGARQNEERAAIARLTSEKMSANNLLNATQLQQQRDLLTQQAAYVDALISGIDKAKNAGLKSIEALEARRTAATQKRDQADIGSEEFFAADREVDRITGELERARALFDNIAKGSIADLQKRRDELAKKLRENLVQGSNAYAKTFEQYAAAAKAAKDAEEALKLPDEVFPAGSLNDLNQELQFLQNLLKSIPDSSPEFARIKDAVDEAQAAVDALNKKLAPKDPKENAAKLKEANLATLSEEERHTLAVADLDAEAEKQRLAAEKATAAQLQEAERLSTEQRLKLEIDFARRRLEILRTSGAATEQEIQQQLNKLNELELKLGIAPTDDGCAEMKELVNNVVTAAETIAQAGIHAWGTWAQAAEASINKQLDLQRARVDEARELAKEGNEVMLIEEKKKLAQLTEERRKAAQRNVAIAQVEAAANASVAIARAAVEGGAWLSAVTIAATVASLVAGFIAARQAAADGVPSFRMGGAFDWSTASGYTGDGHPDKESKAVGNKPYKYHRREVISPHEFVSIGDNKNILLDFHRRRVDLRHMLADVPRGRVELGEVMTPMALALVGGGGMKEEHVDRIVGAIDGQGKTSIVVDKDGVTMMVRGRVKHGEKVNARR